MKSIKQGVIVAALLATSAVSQVTFNSLRDLHLKQNRFGTPSIFEQIEFIQTAVSTVQGLIEGHTKSVFDMRTGDHILQFLRKGQLGDFVACQTCWYGLSEVQTLISNQANQQYIENGAVQLCSNFLRYSTCVGFVNQFADLLINNLLALNLRPDYMCTDALDLCPSYDSSFIELNETSYAQDVLANKPAIIQNDDYIDNLYAQIRADPNREKRQTLKFVQFTDIHMDMYYVSGASKTCPDVICCRATDGFPTDPDQQAGPLGTFGCDIPIDVVTKMGEYINEYVKPDVILWTGDVTPHDQNAYTFEYVSTLQARLAQFFAANLSSYQLYPLEGNHDFVTPNSQDFSKPDPMLAFNLEQWNQYLLPEAQEIYAEAGYYSQKLMTKNSDGTTKTWDNVNIVAVNTEACYSMNFYLMAQRDDPGNVLAWLNETLAGYEQRGEIAVLMAHHPPGSSDCLYQWASRFRAILDRYQHIVRWSVYGHVHLEMYGVAKGIQTGKPTGVHYWAGSVSTWFEVNPSFKMFEVDVETMLPVKSHTYVLDIKNTKDQAQLGWKWDHEVTALYNMTDLSPSSFVELAERINESEDLALLYQRTQSNGGDQTVYQACDENCRKNQYCSITNTVYFDAKDCMGLPRYDIAGDTISTLMEYLSDPWVEKKPNAKSHHRKISIA